MNAWIVWGLLIGAVAIAAFIEKLLPGGGDDP
jgi:hypothetical protein